MARVKLARLLLATLGLVLLAPMPVARGADERERQTVYQGVVFDGEGYRGQFYPANEPSIYLLADVPNLLVPKVTDVYWWPITREYKADWESTDESLTGTLQVGNLTFPMTVYSLRYDGSYQAATTDLLTGEAAVRAHDENKQQRDDYQLAVSGYQQDLAGFSESLEAWGEEVDRRRAEGLSTEDLPAPAQPQPPAQVTVTVTEPQPGIAFSLPPGEHQMRLRAPDGSIVPGSERSVVAFGPRREGVAYRVIAASTYTLPDASNNPNDTIFVSGEVALYIQPAKQREYDAFHAAQLLNTQQKSVQDRRGAWSWLPAGELPVSTLALSVDGRPSRPLDADVYYAKQRPGAALGYEIVPYDESAGQGVSTFAAFEVRPQAGTMTVSAPGVAGSTRQIRTVNTGMGTPLLALAFAPLALGLTLISVRRWRTR